MQWILDHLLWIILFAAAAVTTAWLIWMKDRLRIKWYAAVLLAVVCVLAGVFCVRVFARMEGANSGAMSLFGAVFFMPVFFFIGAKLFRRPTADVFDVLGIPMFFTLFCTRFNCLKSGCCLGTFIHGTSMRWPTRQAEMVFYIIFLIIMAPRVRRGTTHGEVYPVFMISYGIFRAVIECFRESGSPGLFHIAHLWALISIAIGLSVYWSQKERAKKLEKNKKRKRR